MSIKSVFALVTAFAAASLTPLAACADAPATEWTFDGGGTLTEVVPEGGTPWVFYIYDSGVIDLKARGTSTVLNFRTLPDGCKPIVSMGALFRGEAIEEVYLPSTLKTLGQYALFSCSALRVCDIPEDSMLESLGFGALASCPNLEEVRLTDHLETIGDVAINGSCTKVKFIGSTMPDSLSRIEGSFCEGMSWVFSGRLVFGGDDSHDVTIGTSRYPFNSCTALTELVFGAKVTPLTSASILFSNCSGITNIVCRNPDGFCFGPSTSTSYFNNLAGLKQYDLYGWPKGKMIGNGVKTRILAPCDNQTWLDFTSDAARMTPWNQISKADRDAYWTNFYGDGAEAAKAAAAAGEIPTPKGRVAATDQTYEGAVIPGNVYIVFDKGEEVRTVSLMVCGERENTVAAEGETAFFPAYGVIPDVLTDPAYGKSFVCTAPRYAGDLERLYEVTGYRVFSMDSDGDYTILAQSGSFSDDEVRAFTFDTDVLTAKAYKLVWDMKTEVAYAVNVVAPSLPDMGTWTFGQYFRKGYYLPGAEATVTAVGTAGHPFVMWGVADDMCNPTRYDATLRISVDGPKTVKPIFKSDRWELHSVDNAYYLTDGQWKFVANYDASKRSVSITAAAPDPSYGEELDLSLPVYYTIGSAADSNLVHLTSIGGIYKNWPAGVLDRLRKIAFGADFEEVGRYAFYDEKGSISNVTDIVFKGHPSIGYVPFANCTQLRRVACRSDIPPGLPDGITGYANFQIVFDIPRGNVGWEAFLTDTGKVIPWKNALPHQKLGFMSYHPNERNPLGMTENGNGTVPRYQWVRYEHPLGLAVILR